MTTQDYIFAHETNKDLFDKFFGQDAERYWKIWELHNIDGVSYDKLAYQFDYSKSSIKNINDRVIALLNNPTLKDEENEFLSKLLSGSVMYPNEFIGSKTSLSTNAHKLWFETIFLYQNGMKLKIPRNHILYLSTQYKNVERRNKLFDELRQLKIKIDDKEFFAFTKVTSNNGTMEFEFTEECLDYIDPVRRLFNYLRLSDEY